MIYRTFSLTFTCVNHRDNSFLLDLFLFVKGRIEIIATNCFGQFSDFADKAGVSRG